VPVQEANLANSSGSRESPLLTRWPNGAARALIAFAPALILVGLAVVQANDAVQVWQQYTTDPSWVVASELARSVLYASFVLGGAVALCATRGPRARDGRGVVIAASLIASFLMIGVTFLPAGPVLWSASTHIYQVGLLLTVFGAGLALASLTSLKTNFSIVPEARTLVITGPYRLLRHPIYLAELLMIVGVVVGQMHLATLIGALSLVVLQAYRIQREEDLLRRAFPEAFEGFASRTRFRLLPLLW